jgi:hypothetical protein|eukprot:COSAG06_NODE_4119_length_4550_cov_2.137497_5_plen_63_part_00
MLAMASRSGFSPRPPPQRERRDVERPAARRVRVGLPPPAAWCVQHAGAGAASKGSVHMSDLV